LESHPAAQAKFTLWYHARLAKKYQASDQSVNPSKTP
jgi:hypothetical protein